MREDWDYKQLGDIGKVSMCKRIYKKQTSSTGDIPFYKIGTFGKEPDAFISKDLYKEYRSKYSFPNKGDILISASGTIGRRVVYNGEPAYFQDSNIVWISNDETEVLNEYLYAFYGYCDWSPSKGATISRLYNDDLRKTKIPIPPLPEQKRIVVILEEVFEAIDKAKANVERNIENAEELFQSKLEEVFKQLSEQDKITYQLKDVCEYDKITNEKVGIPYVGLADIESDSGRFIGDLSPREMKSRTFYFNENHLLYGRLRPYLNKILVSDFEGHCSTEIFPIKTSNLISKSFLFYWFLKPTTVNKIDKTSTGARMPRANMDDVMNFEIPVPSIEVQKELVDQLIKIKENSLEISQLYKYKKVQLEELKKSILQKAFSGELTANEHVAA